MRRAVPLALLASVLVMVAACGDTTSGNGPTTTPAPASVPAATDGSAPIDTVTKPSVVLPATTPTQLVITERKIGVGRKAILGDKVVVNYVGVRSADGTMFDNSYDRGQPFEVTLGAGQVIPGWEQGLVGMQTGGQRQLDIPASLAYGDQGAGTQIKPGDAISFVVDVVIVLPGSKASEQPKVTVTPAAPTTKITSVDLVVGTGDSPAVGKQFAVRIILYRADTGELLTSTWGAPPVAFGFGPGTNAYPGILAVADGMKVGGRRQAQLPFSQIFDGKGNTNLKVPASVDLIIVMDLIAVY